MTYKIVGDGLGIECEECGRTSWNRNDVANLYCGHCNKFHDAFDARMSSMYYVLTPDRLPVPCFGLMDWGLWMQQADRRVAFDVFGDEPDNYQVSTVFLGIDHSFSGRGDPLLFETAIFDQGGANVVARYSTWAEAAAGHEQVRSIAAHQFAESHRLTAALVKRALTEPAGQ